MGSLEGGISGLVELMQKSAQSLEDIAQVLHCRPTAVLRGRPGGLLSPASPQELRIRLLFYRLSNLLPCLQAPPSIGGWKVGSSKGSNESVLTDQLISAVAALATMSSSGPVAARIASTKGLTQVG